MTASPRAHHTNIIGCQVCGLVLRLSDNDHHPICPRCRSSVHRRRKHSLQWTWLLLIAALLVYIPANLLPVMRIQILGQGDQNPTIISGIFDLWHDGACDIALVVFMASVALPCAKFIAMIGLLVSVHGRARFARRQRTKLHRLLEVIGYWSMLDILVVGILGSVVQFQALGEIEPGAGVFLFGASVILTMLAAHSFDARLIWDDMEIRP